MITFIKYRGFESCQGEMTTEGGEKDTRNNSRYDEYNREDLQGRADLFDRWAKG